MSLCPQCGHAMDLASWATNPKRGKAPKPGDLTVCIRCAAVLAFGGDMRLERAPADAVDSLQREHPAAAAKLRQVRRAIILMGPREPIAATRQ